MPAQDDVNQRGRDQAQPLVDQDGCWICLGDTTEGPLGTFCACPGRVAHERCLARWCLQQAGREEEKNCRFCNGALPDYRKALTKDRAGAAPGGRPPLPTAQRVPNMRVHYGNVTVVMPLMPGEAGKRDFEAGVRKVLKLPADKVLNINFSCNEPGAPVTHPDSKVQLSGLDTYDAAFWCASLTAAERDSQQPVQQQPGMARSASLSRAQAPPQRAGLLQAPAIGRTSSSGRPPVPQPVAVAQPVLAHSRSAPAGLSAPLLLEHHQVQLQQHMWAQHLPAGLPSGPHVQQYHIVLPYAAPAAPARSSSSGPSAAWMLKKKLKSLGSKIKRMCTVN